MKTPKVMFVIHLICGSVFRTKADVDRFSDQLLSKCNFMTISEYDSDNTIIIAKDQIEYIEVCDKSSASVER